MQPRFGGVGHRLERLAAPAFPITNYPTIELRVKAVVPPRTLKLDFIGASESPHLEPRKRVGPTHRRAFSPEAQCKLPFVNRHGGRISIMAMGGGHILMMRPPGSDRCYGQGVSSPHRIGLQQPLDHPVRDVLAARVK